MLSCIENLCFSSIPSKSDRYKYYYHRFFLGKPINVMEDTILASSFLRYFVFIEERYAFLSNEARNKGSFFLDVFRVERKIKKGVPTALYDERRVSTP